MGWLNEHEDRLKKIEADKAKANRADEERSASHRSWAEGEAESLYSKVCEVNGKKTKHGKLTVKRIGNRVSITTVKKGSTKEIASIAFDVYERTEGDCGYGTGEYYIDAHACYNGTDSWQRFNENEFAEALIKLTKGE